MEIMVLIVLMLTAILIEEIAPNWHRKAWASVVKEFNNQVESWGSEGYLGEIVKEGLKVKKAAKETADKDAWKKALTAFLKTKEISCYIGGNGVSYYPFAVQVDAHMLHATRMALREYFGSWTDEIRPGECYEDYDKVHKLRTEYWYTKNDLPYSVCISVKYPLDALPKGLLKEGCKVIREEKVTVTCSVVCG